MSDKKFDSVLVGYTEEPHYYEGSLSNWPVKFKKQELLEMAEKYSTPVKDNGEGGNVFVKLFMSKGGKPCCSVWDPFSEVSKEKRNSREATKEAAVDNDMPF